MVQCGRLSGLNVGCFVVECEGSFVVGCGVSLVVECERGPSRWNVVAVGSFLVECGEGGSFVVECGVWGLLLNSEVSPEFGGLSSSVESFVQYGVFFLIGVLS